LHSEDAMERELLASAEEVARRLRADKLRCLGMTLKVRLGDLTRITRAAGFEEATDLSEPLYAAAVQLLRTRVDFQGQGVRLLGLAATRLVSEEEWSGTLFPDERAKRLRLAAETVDRLRKKFGGESVKRGRLLESRQR